MKTFHIILVFSILLYVDAQRRTTTKPESETIENKPIRTRGRTRYTNTQEFSQATQDSTTNVPNRTFSSRKRINDPALAKRKNKPVQNVKGYEVQEIVSDSPIDSFRRQSKPRVLTDISFQSANILRRPSTVSTTPEIPVEEYFNSFGGTARAILASSSPGPLTRTGPHLTSDDFGNTARTILGNPQGDITSFRNGLKRTRKIIKSRERLVLPSQSSHERPETAARNELLKKTSIPPREKPLFRPETSPQIDELIPSMDTARVSGSEELVDTTFKSNSEESPTETPNAEFETSKETTKATTENIPPSSVKTTEVRRDPLSNRRSSPRQRDDSVEQPGPVSRSRTRSRVSQRPEETVSYTAAPSRVSYRGPRRRQDSSSAESSIRSKGPSVFTSEETQQSKLRTGRRTGGSAPERITLDLATEASTRVRSSSRQHTPVSTTTTERSNLNSNSRRRTSSRFKAESQGKEETVPIRRNTARGTASIGKPNPTESTRNFRSRSRPPIIDEHKLEVLPLFEREDTIISPLSRSKHSISKGRRTNSAEDTIQTSGTENHVKKAPLISSSISVSAESTASTVKPLIKESVISEVNEVTSKRIVTRRRNPAKEKKSNTEQSNVTVLSSVSSRGSKKAELSTIEKKKGSEEEIDESDNYPEAFKALLHAKKQKNESRPSSLRLPQHGVSSTEKVVTSSTAPSSSTIVGKSTATKVQEDENENELIPRFSLTTPIPSTRRSKLTTKPIEKAKTTRKSFASRPSITSQTKKSTTSSPVSSEPLHNKQHRFHAKIKARNDTKPAFAGKIYNSPRGVYSSRSVKQNEKEPNTSETVVSSTPVPKTLKKPTRYSSKYRNDISSRTATPKSTTNAPFYIPTIPTAAYIPTVPTVNPPATTVNFQEGTKDKDLGLEVFMFDDPVNTIHSANLVNGELLTRNKVLNIAALVKEQTTEKPVSIIERIINSITAISTTTAPNISTSSVDDVKSTTEASSAILKLATKKSTRLDKTKPDKPDEKTTNPLVSSTSEKPTTIIEKILSSLNAIQNNETNTEQVDSNRMARVQSISDALQTKAAVTVSTSTTQSSVSSTALPSTTVATSTTLPTTAETTTNSPKNSIVTSIPALTTLSGLLSGKIVESSTELTTNPIPTANYQTLNVNQYNEVLNIQDILNLNRVNKDVVFRWKPVSRPDTTDNHQNTKTVASSTTSTTKPTTLLFTSAPSVSEGTTTAVPRPTVTATNPITRPTTTPSPPTTTSSFPTAFKSMPRYTNTPTTISRTETSTGAPLSTYIPSTTLQPATTFLPALLSTLFPNILRVTSENPFRTYNEFYSESVTPSTERFVTASTSRVTTVVPLTTTEKETTTTQTTTTTTTAATTITTTTTIAPSTTVSTTTTTEAPRTTTTIPLTTVEYVQRSTKRSTETSNSPPVDSKAEYKEAKKLKALTEQQRKDLEEIAKLEKEQAALLQQLSFLTNFVGGPRNTNKPVTPSSLANRIIAMAVEKESSKSTTKKPNSIQDKLEALDSTTKAPSKKSSPSLEDVLKQYNINNLNVTPATLSSTYGTSNDAILASLLKNQGIGPTTPKTLREQLKQSNFVETTTTKEPKPKTKSRPRTTTQRPTSRLMQGLNWLINAFSDPTTSRPPVRRPTKSKKPPVDQELLTNQPTRITPVVTAAPKTLPKSLSQEEIRDLIKQLEEIQKDPKNRDQLDFSKIKSIQNLIEGTDGVEISHSGEHGATSRVTTRLPKTTKIVATKEKQRSIRTTTNRNPTESNNIEDDTDFEPTTAKQRPSLPPLRLRPIPGIDDGNNNSDPLIRGNLITAAVNVTRAISSFLGSALQGAAQSFQSLIGSGSSVVGNISQGSSSSRPS